MPEPAATQTLSSEDSGYFSRALGAYRVLRKIGEGGMGRVYLAEHTKLRRKVAIKVLRPDCAKSPKVVARFFAEARAAIQIAHAHIVEITDFVEDPEHDCYYVMELLHGRDLAQELATGVPLSPERLVDIGTQVASAVAAAHDAQIIHRDLKPENVFLTQRDGRVDYVKLLDFGVAKLSHQELLDVPLDKTSAGSVVGTPQYMSPEQAAGREIDGRSDIYSFGVICYEALAGRLPIVAKSLGELVLRLQFEAPDPLRAIAPRVPADLAALVMQCLEKDPEQRPRTMHAVEEALRGIAELEGWSVESRSFSRKIAVPPAPARYSKDEATLAESSDVRIKPLVAQPVTQGAPAPIAEPRARSPRVRAMLAGVAGALVLGACATALAWHLHDGPPHVVAAPRTAEIAGAKASTAALVNASLASAHAKAPGSPDPRRASPAPQVTAPAKSAGAASPTARPTAAFDKSGVLDDPYR